MSNLTLTPGQIVKVRSRPRISQLVQWIKANLCPDLGKPDAVWLDKRVIIFTEYTDTKD